jgi:hypothetical protein
MPHATVISLISVSATRCVPSLPKVHCRVHKSPPLGRHLSHLNPVHTFTPLYMSPSHLCLDIPSALFPWNFSTENFVWISHLVMRTTWAAHLVIYLIAWVILSKNDKLLSSSSCCFHHPPVTSCLLLPNTILLPNNLNQFSSLSVRDQITSPNITTPQYI